MSDSDGIAQEPTGLDGLPPMHSISKGEVVSVQTYGAFVRLPGYKKEGWKKVHLFFVQCFCKHFQKPERWNKHTYT